MFLQGAPDLPSLASTAYIQNMSRLHKENISSFKNLLPWIPEVSGLCLFGADASCMNGRSFRLLKEEESGSYQCGMLLNQRYLIQRLLGRGGFSEVYQVTQPCINRQAMPCQRFELYLLTAIIRNGLTMRYNGLSLRNSSC